MITRERAAQARGRAGGRESRRRSILGEPKHVVIVGGGFAGMACAKHLAKDHDLRITLIDRNNYHQFQPLLYQVATAQLGSSDIASPLRTLSIQHPNIAVKLAEVTAVDPAARSVTTQTGETYSGDFVVLAAAQSAQLLPTPGAAEHAYPLYSLADAQRLRSRIISVFEQADRDRLADRRRRADLRHRRWRRHRHGDRRCPGGDDQGHHDRRVP